MLTVSGEKSGCCAILFVAHTCSSAVHVSVRDNRNGLKGTCVTAWIRALLPRLPWTIRELWSYGFSSTARNYRYFPHCAHPLHSDALPTREGNVAWEVIKVS